MPLLLNKKPILSHFDNELVLFSEYHAAAVTLTAEQAGEYGAVPALLILWPAHLIQEGHR